MVSTGCANRCPVGHLLANAVAVDAPNQRALVIGESAVFAVDLATGARTILSGSGVGAGPAFQLLRTGAWDAASNTVFAIDSNQRALVAVDIQTGTRTIVSNATRGSGPMFTVPWRITVDSAGQRLLVVDRGAILAVDIPSGNRAVLVDTSAAAGLPLSPSSMVWDSENQLILATDSMLHGLIAIDARTGERVIVSHQPPAP